MEIKMSEITKHKTTILQKLLSDEELIKAVYYPDSNYLDKPKPDTGLIMYRNIFPYRYVPTTTEEARAYITMSISYRKSGTYFKVGSITLFVFCNQDIMTTDYGFLRVDHIISRIDTIINKSREFGIGKIELDMVDEMVVEGKMPGMYIRYKMVDLQ